jgi:NADH-quinone oxidoreductase subunit A
VEIADYTALVILTGLALLVGAAITFAGTVFGPKNPTKQKLMPYESGSDPLSRPREQRFSVKFYMVAISFILFDLETVFVIPWAVSWNQSQALGHAAYSFMVMFVFVVVLTIGLVYEWKQGGLEWD